jgi:hypothetical protein
VRREDEEFQDEPGRLAGTIEGELVDERGPDEAPSSSGMALVEERAQRRAAALVKALSALVEGGLLLQARPIAEELARLLDPEADELLLGEPKSA